MGPEVWELEALQGTLEVLPNLALDEVNAEARDQAQQRHQDAREHTPQERARTREGGRRAAELRRPRVD